ncbi:tRNA epoxyqueuosine(34) reductase QueG [Cytophagales bacterium LB-30]|uniref:Epoxyqueuosine reductase n=1 Tax=Shiella aurantiaca TaxID=3058365 RepID=A0ABT8F6E9_9BACT|nr:tRNA epoxyqueuosine(34) reductase QueG [Shiella aurantiaca]MDN4166051.1 tRNA epoxyqueuosine(34) reductase QueG [Shiella aurantiaca]
MQSQAVKYSQWVKEEAARLGFDSCGIAKADFLEEEAPRLEKWLQMNHQGKMAYMENHFDKRLDPRLLVEGARSVISLTYNYYPEQDLVSKQSYKVSKYAYGTDYHLVIKEKLREMVATLQEKIGEIQGRVFVDSAPVMERQWAAKSGLGWIGKNSLLLSKQKGSFFFLAEIISDLDLQADSPVTDHCGSCTRCIDACPTQAIPQPYVVDGSKCISYYTIELKENLPQELKNTFQDWIFGCDICQDVCPWNRFSTPHREPAFAPREFAQWSKADWHELTEEVFRKVFKDSPLKRPGFERIKNNLPTKVK